MSAAICPDVSICSAELNNEKTLNADAELARTASIAKTVAFHCNIVLKGKIYSKYPKICNLTLHVENFTIPLDLFVMSIWNDAHKRHFGEGS